jgi:hypothetical protein
MILRTIGILALLMTMLVAASDVQARIYKTVDEDGNVVFTDVPPKDHSKAIEIEAGNFYETPQPTNVAPNRRRAEEPAAGDDAEDMQEPAVNYSTLQIVNPGADEPVRENAGNLNVVLSVRPALKANHRVQILLDGTVFATNVNTHIQLTNVDRGTHVLTAQIIDSDGTVLMSSDPTSFHMQRISLNSPSRAPS